MKSILLSLLTILSVACNSQKKNTETKEPEQRTENSVAEQIGEYVVEINQDSKGNLWFGTLEKGIAKYDGDNLIYLTIDDGLPSNRITSIVEDGIGNLWFGTGAGISKYDGKSFTNYSEKDGLCSDMISCLFIDSRRNFWIGTWGGVCKFDGESFETVSIPYAELDTKINPDTKDWITSIAEDSNGNIWFGRDGFGASRFDGSSFDHFTTREGLNSNNVQSIVQDNDGNIWIGTRVAEKDNPDSDKRMGKGGLNKYDGFQFVRFTDMEGLSENGVYSIYLDRSNDLWISTISNGVFKYTDNEFVNYKVPASTTVFFKGIDGSVWLGCAGGLYKIDKDGEVINVKVDGPWK